jgi:hypothetical protein
MLIVRPGQSASRQPGRFRPDLADGWPARPADGKFANFKINQFLTQFQYLRDIFEINKGLSNDF